VLALALFVGAGLAILTMIDVAVERAQRTQSADVASDIAASAIACVESGVLSPEAVQGPVARWRPDVDRAATPREGPDAWYTTVQMTPQDDPGLVMMHVRVWRGPAREGSAPVGALSQLVRLREPPEERIESAGR
jgi:hypothetical protein